MDKEKLDEVIWSYSRVESYASCPKRFYLSYIKKVKKTQNAFAQWGSWCHELLEMYFKGKAEFYELSQIYEEGYKKHVKKRFPYCTVDLSKSYYDQGKKYFDSFEGIPDSFKVLGVEKKINIKIQNYTFKGYIDLILEDNNGDLLIWDHKSKGNFKSRKELDKYLIQLYLYSLYIEKSYGKPPSKLVFNMFRTGGIIEEQFNKKEQEKALIWLSSNISKIYCDNEFKDKIEISYEEKERDLALFKKNDFFCNELCGVRKHCIRSRCYKNRGDN